MNTAPSCLICRLPAVASFAFLDSGKQSRVNVCGDASCWNAAQITVNMKDYEMKEAELYAAREVCANHVDDLMALIMCAIWEAGGRDLENITPRHLADAGRALAGDVGRKNGTLVKPLIAIVAAYGEAIKKELKTKPPF